MLVVLCFDSSGKSASGANSSSIFISSRTISSALDCDGVSLSAPLFLGSWPLSLRFLLASLGRRLLVVLVGADSGPAPLELVAPLLGALPLLLPRPRLPLRAPLLRLRLVEALRALPRPLWMPKMFDPHSGPDWS